jgi:uncharacterized damage-inducible protein DinB
MSLLRDTLELFAFNRWANERTLDAAATLTPEQYARPLGGSFPSLRATLQHMMGAEISWLARFHGEVGGRFPDLSGYDDVPKLRAAWDDVWAEQQRYLASLDYDALRRPLAFRFRDGTEGTQPLVEALRHVVNHASYHRGQVVMLIRQLGGVPAGTDYITYCLARGAR